MPSTWYLARHSLRNVLLNSPTFSHGFPGAMGSTQHYGTLWECKVLNLEYNKEIPCMGPLLFSMVLHKLILTIIEDTECSQLLFISWYLDDGVLSGTKSVISWVVTLIQKLGPALGSGSTLPNVNCSLALS